MCSIFVWGGLVDQDGAFFDDGDGVGGLCGGGGAWDGYPGGAVGGGVGAFPSGGQSDGEVAELLVGVGGVEVGVGAAGVGGCQGWCSVAPVPGVGGGRGFDQDGGSEQGGCGGDGCIGGVGDQWQVVDGAFVGWGEIDACGGEVHGVEGMFGEWGEVDGGLWVGRAGTGDVGAVCGAVGVVYGDEFAVDFRAYVGGFYGWWCGPAVLRGISVSAIPFSSKILNFRDDLTVSGV